MNRNAKIAFLLMLTTLLLVTAAWSGPRVAVMDFENKSRHGGWRLGRGAADMLTTELVKMGTMEMFERDRLNSVLKEQNIGASGRMDPTTAARIGKVIGVQYIITGAVTEYGRSTAGGGGAGVKFGKTDYSTTVDVRMVDATSGRIVFADTGNNTVTSMNVQVFGFGGGQKFNEKAATDSMRGAIGDVSKKLTAVNMKNITHPKSPGAISGKALIADVDGKLITLNKGSSAGFKKGQVVTAKRKGKVIKDPATGKVIKVRYRTIGKIKLKEVDTGYAEGNVINGSGFKVGDIIQ